MDLELELQPPSGGIEAPPVPPLPPRCQHANAVGVDGRLGLAVLARVVVVFGLCRVAKNLPVFWFVLYGARGNEREIVCDTPSCAMLCSEDALAVREAQTEEFVTLLSAVLRGDVKTLTKLKVCKRACAVDMRACVRSD